MEKGTQLGQYEIISVLGKGGMGEVYLARDTRPDRRVALKILPAGLAADGDRLIRFVREAQSASALNHPNIITVHDIGNAAGMHFIADEFIDGTTLREFARSPAWNSTSALEIGTQIASALVEAHHAGIVHRDLKPDNVMIRASGLVKLLDFGIARLTRPAESDHDAATAIYLETQAGLLIGTPQFMSPEQARGTDVDHQTDIFSFGVALYEMLSGASPFAGDNRPVRMEIGIGGRFRPRRPRRGRPFARSSLRGRTFLKSDRRGRRARFDRPVRASLSRSTHGRLASARRHTHASACWT